MVCWIPQLRELQDLSTHQINNLTVSDYAPFERHSLFQCRAANLLGSLITDYLLFDCMHAFPLTGKIALNYGLKNIPNCKFSIKNNNYYLYGVFYILLLSYAHGRLGFMVQHSWF